MEESRVNEVTLSDWHVLQLVFPQGFEFML